MADDTKTILMDFSPDVPISFSNLNAETIKKELVKQLEEKERLLGELSGGGISRNVLQRQINQFKERLHDIEQIDELGEIDKDYRVKLESLERELSAVKSEQGPPLPVSRIFNHNSTSLLPSAINNSTPTKRRSKVPGGNKRNSDMEFATEIGQGLLIEVRKLQAALQNKEEIIKQLHIVKSDDERTTEMLMKHLKQKEESEERYKEQNWGLEVTNEELRTSLAESNQFVNKSKIENARLTKQLRTASEQNDSLKAQVEKAAATAKSTKIRHEQDIQALKRTIASLQRENIAFKEKVQSLDSELDVQRTRLSLRSTSTDGTNREEKPSLPQKLQDVTPQSSTSTPIKSTNQQLELTTTKQSLTHAHRMINNLRTTLQKEKQEKHELKKLLSDSQETIEHLQHEINNFDTLGRNRTKASKKVEGKTSRRVKAMGMRTANMPAVTGDSTTLHDPSREDADSQSDPDLDDTLDDSESEKSFNHGLLDFSYMSGRAETKSLGSELADTLTLREQRNPAIEVPDKETKAQSTEMSNNIDHEQHAGVLQQKTLSTSTLEPMSAAPTKMDSSHHQTPALLNQQLPQQSILSTSTLRPLDMPPAAATSTDSQSTEQYLDVSPTNPSQRPLDIQHLQVKDFNVEPRQRTLSASSMELLDLPPVQTTTLTHQAATQTAPRQRTLSTSRMEPMDLPPIESNVVTLLAGTQTAGPDGTQMGTQTDTENLDVNVLLPRQRTLITTSIEPLSAMPVVPTTVALQTGTQTDAIALDVQGPVPKQRTFSTSSMKPLSAIPAEIGIVTVQNGTQTDAQTLGVKIPVPRQRTLSTSSMEPLSAIPAESNIVTFQNGTQTDAQTLDVEASVPRERTLSTSTMEPLSLPPTGSTIVIHQTGMQTDKQTVMQMGTQTDEQSDAQAHYLTVPTSRQRTLSTSSMEPLSAVPSESKNIALQAATQTLNVDSPAPRQRTLSTSTMEPLSVMPRQRSLSTSKLDPLSASPANSGSIAIQTNAQVNAFEIITQQHIDNLNEVANAEKERSVLQITTLDSYYQPSVDSSSLQVESSQDLFGEIAQWETTSDLSLHITPANSLSSDTDEVEQRQIDNESVTVQETMQIAAKNEVINTHQSVDASVQVIAEDLESDDKYLEMSKPITNSPVEANMVDSATSPINNFFPTDIHSSNYVAGPNGEDMMSRKEAEALATAYFADALSKDKAQHSSQRLAWEQKRLLKGSSMSFLNAPPRPERPPSPMLIAKTQKPPVTPKLQVAPSPKPSISTPIPFKNKKIRSSTSIASLRPSDSAQDLAENKESKDDFGHVTIRKGSLVPSTSSSLTSSPVESLSDRWLKRKPSLVSQNSFSMYNSPSTPSSLSVISAITKTMIGDWLWKYTRRTVGGGISEHRHRRFFWVHPYTRTLYWSAVEPGVDGSEALAKSAYVEAVMSVPNRSVLSDSSASLLIKTPNRELKLTAPDMEGHALWYKSLSYLLDRPAMEQPPTVSSSIDSVQRTQSTRLPRKPSFQRMQALFSRSRPDDTSSVIQEVRNEVKPSLEEDHEDCESDGEYHDDVRQCCDGKHHLHTLAQRTAETSSSTTQ